MGLWGVPGLWYLKERSQEEQGSCQIHGQLGSPRKTRVLGYPQESIWSTLFSYILNILKILTTRIYFSWKQHFLSAIPLVERPMSNSFHTRSNTFCSLVNLAGKVGLKKKCWDRHGKLNSTRLIPHCSKTKWLQGSPAFNMQHALRDTGTEWIVQKCGETFISHGLKILLAQASFCKNQELAGSGKRKNQEGLSGTQVMPMHWLWK